MRKLSFLFGILGLFILSACAQSGLSSQDLASPPTAVPANPTPTFAAKATLTDKPTSIPTIQEILPSSTSVVEEMKTPSLTPTLRPTLSPDEWKDLPIIPEISPRVKDIYQRGIELGNNPRAFSKIGDCGSTPAWFLGDFDHKPDSYSLGEYTYLMPVIEQFQGSFSRTSLAAKAGFNASSIFTTLWSDRKQCQPEETPLACEYRIQRPIAAFIMLGSNDVWHIDSFEPRMREIIEYSIDHGVIPILSTKADNLEKDGSINLTIARLAQEYQIPLLNYWRAVQPLPDQGLQEDQVHITWAPNRFDDPKIMQAGWPVRNLVTLQILDAVWRTATEQEPAQP